MTTIKASTIAREIKLERVFKECLKECDSLDIHYDPRIVNVNENGRITKMWGYCRETKCGCRLTYTISIAKMLLDDDVPIRVLKETMLHEICHTVNFSDSHDGEWLESVTRLNRIYGYNIKDKNSIKDKGISRTLYESKMDYKYIIKCNKCTNVWKFTRLNNEYKHPENFRCRCGGEIVRA